MKVKLSFVAIAISALFSINAQAHGCGGQGACAQNTSNYQPSQQQGQSSVVNHTAPATATLAGQMNNGGVASENRSGASVVNGTRYLNVRPVRVEAPHVVAPSADVSRLVSAECGPRMRRLMINVDGINNRVTETEKIHGVAREDNLLPDYDQPYRKVQLTPHIYQLIGHRVIETTAVVTVSTGGGFGFSAFGSAGGGGSIGGQSAGAIQRLVTTIRLQECVAFEVDTRPLKPRG